MQSVSIVPVGLSKFRDGLEPLEPFTPEDAKKVILQVQKLQEKAIGASDCLLKDDGCLALRMEIRDVKPFSLDIIVDSHAQDECAEILVLHGEWDGDCLLIKERLEQHTIEPFVHRIDRVIHHDDGGAVAQDHGMTLRGCLVVGYREPIEDAAVGFVEMRVQG